MWWGWWRRWSRRSVVVNRPHRRRRWRRPRWRGRRGAELEDQPRPVLRIAKSDRSTVVDENCRHPHAVDVDPAFAPIDRDPLPAVVMQQQLAGRAGCAPAVEPDVYVIAAPDGHISACGKGVLSRAKPNDQGRTERPERVRRHGHPPLPPLSPSSWSRTTLVHPPWCAESRSRVVGAGQPPLMQPLARRARPRGRRGIVEQAAQHGNGIHQGMAVRGLQIG